jgi:hypothetical protein
MVTAFLNAFREEIPRILRIAFEATGFDPFNPDRPLASPVDEGHPPGTFDGVVGSRARSRPNCSPTRIPSLRDSLQRHAVR